MIKVGITGNIGSGKTTVCKVFETLNIPIFNADEAARKVYLNDNVKKEVISLLGTESYYNNILNKEYVAKKIFNNPSLLESLNKIIHPATFDFFYKWVEKQNSYYCIKEAAILFESGADKTVDYVICIAAPLELRINRIIQRNKNLSKEDVLGRMKNQWQEEKIIALSDFIISNDETDSVIKQVIAIHNKILLLKK